MCNAVLNRHARFIVYWWMFFWLSNTTSLSRSHRAKTNLYYWFDHFYHNSDCQFLVQKSNICLFLVVYGWNKWNRSFLCGLCVLHWVFSATYINKCRFVYVYSEWNSDDNYSVVVLVCNEILANQCDWVFDNGMAFSNFYCFMAAWKSTIFVQLEEVQRGFVVIETNRSN